MMLDFLQRYILNFWIWWYVIVHKAILAKLFGSWGFVLGKLNVVPMLTNLFQPLFQDFTKVGRLIAFPIRSIWVLIGSSIQIIVTIPLLFIYVVYLAMPMIPVWAVISYFVL